MGLEWYMYLIIGVAALISIVVVIDVKTKRGIKEKKAAEKAERKKSGKKKKKKK